MATSGSNDFNMTRDEIVSAAYRKIQVYRSGETLSAEELFDGCEALNVMIKAWQNKGICVWLNQEIAVFLQKGKSCYFLGPDGDAATARFTTGSLSKGSDPGDYWLHVDSSEEVQDGDWVGYEQPDGSLAWSQAAYGEESADGIALEQSTNLADPFLAINGSTASGGTARSGLTRRVTLYSQHDNSAAGFRITGLNYIDEEAEELVAGPSAGETVSSVSYFKTVSSIEALRAWGIHVMAGWGKVYEAYHQNDPVIPITGTIASPLAGGAVIYAFTEKIRRPLEIIEARYHYRHGTDVPLHIVDAEQYKRIPNKNAYGKAVEVYYDPQLNHGALYVWPVSQTVRDWLVLTVKIPVDDLDSVVDNAQFPPEWLEALIYNLAERLAPEFGRAPTLEVKTRAYESLQEAIQADRGTLPYRFAPNLKPYQ